MQQLTSEGQQLIHDLSQRHGFSADAVTHMLFAVLHGNGAMAQFSHPEFAGSGQWMQGGMLMLGDMFNYALKNRVNALCAELSSLLANQPGLLRSGSFQSQSQSSGSGAQAQVTGALPGESSLFVPDPSAQWWPAALGAPTASGSQNQVRYAYFANAARLAVETQGQVWLYDTGNHQIGGFSQQQGLGGSILFSSQYGTVNLASLPVVSIDGYAPVTSYATVSAPVPRVGEEDVYAAIERLGELHAKGLLTHEEFAQKKTELLGRL